MPDDIQDRISHVIDTAIDTKITPGTALLDNKIEALSAAQAYSAMMTQNLEKIGRTATEAMRAKALEDRKTTKRLENKLELVLMSQKSSAKATEDLHTKLKGLSVAHSTSTDLVMQNAQQMGQETTKVICMQTFESRVQSSSLHKKLDQVDALVDAIRNLLQNLSSVQLNLDSDMSKAGVERAVQNILGSIWLLLSSLQLLICELVYVSTLFVYCLCIDNTRMLLAPYLIAFYRNTVQGLMLYGDHFLFEDAVGRIKRLPCIQFQHWNVHISFLHTWRPFSNINLDIL
jgi:hypothetical protein